MPDLSSANPLLFFGCGNMGRAMLEGWLKSGIEPTSFIVVDPSTSEYPAGVACYRESDAVPHKATHAIVAVKPQLFPEVAENLAKMLDEDALLISVMAGVRSSQMERMLPGRRMVRLMPNLAAAIGKAPLGLFSSFADARQLHEVDALLAPLGTPVWIEDEELMDAVTALAGSGPAFVYRFIDALANAGEALGLSHDVSARLAMTMVEGSVALAASADVPPAELACRVTSPGGTTAAGLAVLDAEDALVRMVLATLKAARDRGADMASA